MLAAPEAAQPVTEIAPVLGIPIYSWGTGCHESLAYTFSSQNTLHRYSAK